MVDITHKSNTLRTAKAQAIVKVSSQDTITAIENKTVPKGDVFSMSKAAGLLGVKKTNTKIKCVNRRQEKKNWLVETKYCKKIQIFRTKIELRSISLRKEK